MGVGAVETVRRFHALLGMVLALLAVVTVAVVAVGDQTEPLPVSVQPQDGAQDVVSTASLVLRFGRPVEQAAVAEHLEIDPPTPGTLEVDRSVVRFTPTGGFRPGTQYTATLRRGFPDVTGRALRRDVRLTFATRPPRLLISQPEPGDQNVLAPRNLWVTALDDQPPRPLTREPHGILFAAVAPDGQRVAYTASDPAVPDASALWVVNLDGSGRQKAAGDAGGAILSLSWSPRGDIIAYERRSIVGTRGELGRPRILGVRPDGGGAGLIYGRGEESGALPVWSPDGLRLLASDVAAGGRVVVEPAGTARAAVGLPSGGTDSGTWNADGQQIAIADLEEQRDATRSVIRVLGRDGQPDAQLARAGFSDTAPAWSPDGSTIAVVGLADDGTTGIWLLDPTGASPAIPVSLPDEATGSQFAPPVWSSGGALLAFGRLVEESREEAGQGGALVPVWELWVAHGDGTGARRLPVNGLPEGWVP